MSAAPLHAEVLPPGALDARRRAEMFALMGEAFVGVEREPFERDLDEKDEVILFTDGPGGPVTGFAPQRLLRDAAGAILYSGDTVLAPSRRGDRAWVRAWVRRALELAGREPGGVLPWLPLVSNVRSYRLIQAFWAAYWPRPGVETPAPVARRRDALLQARFGAGYDDAVGVVRPAPPAVPRNGGSVPPHLRADPHVTLFAALNPGHPAGDLLAFWVELSQPNATAAARRLVGG